MSVSWWNVIVWLIPGWLFIFCVLEAPAAFKNFTEKHFGWRVPWDTFSRFSWDAQARFEILTVGVVALLAILASHLIRLKGIQEGDGPIKKQIQHARVKRAKAIIAKAEIATKGA